MKKKPRMLILSLSVVVGPEECPNKGEENRINWGSWHKTPLILEFGYLK